MVGLKLVFFLPPSPELWDLSVGLHAWLASSLQSGWSVVLIKAAYIHAWKYNMPGSNKYFPRFRRTGLGWLLMRKGLLLKTRGHAWPPLLEGYWEPSGKKPEFLPQCFPPLRNTGLWNPLRNTSSLMQSPQGLAILETASMKYLSLIQIFS